MMKNVTVSIDEDSYTRARVIAAQRGTSVSRLVRDFLHQLDQPDTAAAEQWQSLWQEIDQQDAVVGKTPNRARTYADARLR